MWKIITSRKGLLSILFSLFFLLPGLSLQASSTTVIEPQSQKVEMSYEQYSQLKSQFNLLKKKLAKLETNSQADKNQLKLLKNQINRADNSLANANESLETSKENLKTLTEQINSLTHKIAIKERQNKLAWTVTGIVAAIAISK